MIETQASFIPIERRDLYKACLVHFLDAGELERYVWLDILGFLRDHTLEETLAYLECTREWRTEEEAEEEFTQVFLSVCKQFDALVLATTGRGAGMSLDPVKTLKEADVQQTRFQLIRIDEHGTPIAFCAIGYLAYIAGVSVDEVANIENDDEPDYDPIYAEVQTAYGLTENDCLSIVEWNDFEYMCFENIAERLRGRRVSRIIEPYPLQIEKVEE